MKLRLSVVGAAALACIHCPCVLAQDISSLKPVVVTGNPLGSDELIAPVESLSGPALERRRGATLGEALDGLPGVSSSGFGPNASRPVIRGMDGDRVRILDNSGGLSDASALSDDHAVAVDPLSIDRIEVLRGPSALLYGGSAMGGVVNIIDNRISPQALFSAQGGISAKVDASNGSGPRGHALGAMLEAGTDRYTLHLDAFDRRHADLRTRQALCEAPDESLYSSRRICNSASESQGGGIGLTLHGGWGHIGIAHQGLSMLYGTVAEAGVTIGLHNEKTRLAGEWKSPAAGIESLKWQWGHSRYRHTEFDAGEAATTFALSANDLRIEVRHAPWLGWVGVLGLQSDRGTFAADGEEAYAPYSRTRKQALFVHEELPRPWGRWQWGLRWEDVRVASLGNPDVPRLNDAIGERRFNPRSAGLGVLFKLGAGWEATGQLGVTQRAPRDSELYANGPHAATNAWEVGNPALGVETARSLEAGLAWATGEHRVRINAYLNRIRNHILLQDTGWEEEDLPVYAYTATRARFRGLELSGSHPIGLPWPGKWFADWRADLVRADNIATGEPLPRIAPVRLGATLRLERGKLSGELGFDHHLRQSRVPNSQLPTDGHTLWHLRGEYQLRQGPTGQLNAYMRLNNLGDARAFSATSVLTQTAPGKNPLPGRHLTLGMRWLF
jgi:iron complex outermembrane receptor protein